MKSILFEAENYFNDLSLTKESKKIPEGNEFSKKLKICGFNIVFNSASPWPYWCTGTAEQNKFEPWFYKDRQFQTFLFSCILWVKLSSDTVCLYANPD
jgi:hypothetical protein